MVRREAGLRMAAFRAAIDGRVAGMIPAYVDGD